MPGTQSLSYCTPYPKSTGSKCKTFHIITINNRYSKVFAVVQLKKTETSG